VHKGAHGRGTHSIFQNQTWYCQKILGETEVMDSTHGVIGNICIRVLIQLKLLVGMGN
jgi:hypothetical protein